MYTEKEYKEDLEWLRERPVGHTPTHPGVTLADELEARGIDPAVFAETIGVDVQFVKDFIAGNRSVTLGFAAALERGLGISQRFWVRHQMGYEKTALVRAAREETERRAQVIWDSRQTNAINTFERPKRMTA